MRRWMSWRTRGDDVMAASMASRSASRGRLADEQALHLGGQDDGDGAQQQADEHRARPRPSGVVGHGGRPAGTTKAMTRPTRAPRVLEQQHRQLGGLGLADELPPAERRRAARWTRGGPCGTRSPPSPRPRPGWPGPSPVDSSAWGWRIFSTPSKMANTDPRANSTIDTTNAPEVALAAVAERVRLGGGELGAPVAEQQQQLVAGVGQRVHALGQHRRRAGEGEPDELGHGDAQVGQQRGEDRSLAAAGGHAPVLADPRSAVGRAAGRRRPGRWPARRWPPATGR